MYVCVDYIYIYIIDVYVYYVCMYIHIYIYICTYMTYTSSTHLIIRIRELAVHTGPGRRHGVRCRRLHK